MSDFGKNFKALRLKSGLTQAALAEEIEMSRSAVGMYESGCREPDFKTLEVIADFFNIDMDSLIGRNANYNSKNEYEPSYEDLQSLIARNGKNLTLEQKQEIIKSLLSDD